MPGDGQYLPSPGLGCRCLSDTVRKTAKILGTLMAGLVLLLFPRRPDFGGRGPDFPRSLSVAVTVLLMAVVLLAASEDAFCQHALPCRYACPSPNQNSDRTNPQLRGSSHLVKNHVWQGDRAWICFVRYI